MDWADDEAEKALHYLLVCDSHAEKVELLAATFRMIESKGACRASAECIAALDKMREQKMDA